MSEQQLSKSPSMKLMKKPAATKAAPAAPSPAAEPVEAAQSLVESPAVAEIEAVEAVTDTKSDSSDLIVATAHEVENLKEEKAFKLIPQLLDSSAQSDFKLGGVLSIIQREGWYGDRGYENFRAYVEAECGLNYRKAMYLIAIYNSLVESGVKWESVKGLGWTKLKELASIVTVDNVDEWVAIASEMTVLQLQEYIKSKSAGAAPGTGETKAKAQAEAKKTMTVTFKVHADQKETIKAALAKAKHESGTDVDTVALEHICLDFLGGTKVGQSLAELMKGKTAEEVLGVFGEVFPDVEIEATIPES